ncbi:MAG: hypothetical protein KBB04_00365 [Methanothrix sp.]|uniref:hypothetical protein n=1 Tax=Methanothrix sp. TaxID=90426 RepID=UPI001B3D771D|nr:hypothetical protein [Methanothrix sp.]MBP7066724.1 hypothetical protein [Methanothrix sp.]
MYKMAKLYSFKMYRLDYFEEIVGILHEIMNQDDTPIALVGKIQLALPAELEKSLRPLIGQKVAILRTDIPDKQYLFRVIPEESGFNQSDPESKPAIDGNGDTGPILSASTQEAMMLNRTRGPESWYLPELENTPDSLKEMRCV